LLKIKLRVALHIHHEVAGDAQPLRQSDSTRRVRIRHRRQEYAHGHEGKNCCTKGARESSGGRRLLRRSQSTNAAVALKTGSTERMARKTASDEQQTAVESAANRRRR